MTVAPCQPSTGGALRSFPFAGVAEGAQKKPRHLAGPGRSEVRTACAEPPGENVEASP